MKQLKTLTERWRDIVLSCVKFDWQPLPLSWFYVMLPAVHTRLTLWQHAFIWAFFCCFFPVEFGWKPGYWSPWDTNSALPPPPSELQPQKWVMQSTWKEISNFNVTVKAASLLRHRSIIINIQYSHGSNRNTFRCVWNERGRNSTCLNLILKKTDVFSVLFCFLACWNLIAMTSFKGVVQHFGNNVAVFRESQMRRSVLEKHLMFNVKAKLIACWLRLCWMSV